MSIQLVLAWLVAIPYVAAVTVNSGYFSFPLKSDETPTVHNGDLLNITWLSNYDQATLYFWCGKTQMDAIRGLAGDGTMQYSVNTSWSSPCHWQFALQTDESKYMDSGFVDVTNSKATPAAVTWGPTAAKAACGVQTVTTSIAGKTITSTPTPTVSSQTSDDAKTSCASDDSQPPLGTGASIGVGVVIGAAVAGIASAIWFTMRKRALASQSQPDDAAYYHEQGKFHELNPMTRPVEADGSWDARKRNHASAIELPHEPFRTDSPARESR